MREKNILYMVIPCYNEEEVLPETTKRLRVKLHQMIDGGVISELSRIVYVDDGSKDDTWNLIMSYHAENDLVCGIKLSRNRGHQNALWAGLSTVKDHCDMAISIDADLQDDIGVLDQFVLEYEAGHDVVYGVRSARKKDTVFKRLTAEGYYKLLSHMGVEIVYNHADYRLMSRRAIEALMEYKEVNLFLRGIVPMIGFPSSTVYYERDKRFAGKSKYPLKKMLAFAFDGITSLSIKPIRFITTLGFLLFVVSMIFMVYFLIGAFVGHTVPGWSTLVISIWALGGLQLLAIGIIGEYIGKIYLETKGRPRFCVDVLLLDDKMNG
ncbi:Glycosyltransferase involved in cell wall bisynthesis [Lachnospiraceae bacterium XBD2001]|nr:Glycosyltransferase involved in cell wall bisynthesis [Lachnospiraceae bacterium XBD2001]